MKFKFFDNYQVEIPTEFVQQIISLLDQKSLMQLTQTCKTLFVEGYEQRLNTIFDKLFNTKISDVNIEKFVDTKIQAICKYEPKTKTFCAIQNILQRYSKLITTQNDTLLKMRYDLIVVYIKNYFGILGYITPQFASIKIDNLPTKKDDKLEYLTILLCIKSLIEKEDNEFINTVNDFYPNFIRTQHDSLHINDIAISNLIDALQSTTSNNNIIIAVENSKILLQKRASSIVSDSFEGEHQDSKQSICTLF